MRKGAFGVIPRRETKEEVKTEDFLGPTKGHTGTYRTYRGGEPLFEKKVPSTDIDSGVVCPTVV